MQENEKSGREGKQQTDRQTCRRKGKSRSEAEWQKGKQNDTKEIKRRQQMGQKGTMETGIKCKEFNDYKKRVDKRAKIRRINVGRVIEKSRLEAER